MPPKKLTEQEKRERKREYDRQYRQRRRAEKNEDEKLQQRQEELEKKLWEAEVKNAHLKAEKEKLIAAGSAGPIHMVPRVDVNKNWGRHDKVNDPFKFHGPFQDTFKDPMWGSGACGDRR